MEVLCHQVESKCYPRYQYTLKIKKDITARYNRLLYNLDLDHAEKLDDIAETNICIYLCNTPEHDEDFPAIENVVLRASSCRLIEKREVSTISDIFKANSDVLHRKLLFVVSKEEITNDMLPDAFHGHIIYIANNPKEAVFYINEKSSTDRAVCLVDDVGQTICNILEKHALAGMKQKCEYLNKILSSSEEDTLAVDASINEVESTSEASRNSKNPSMKKRSVSFDTGPNKQTFYEKTSLTKFCSDTAINVYTKGWFKLEELKSATFNGRSLYFPLKQKVRENRETIERLIDEIIGVFNRSNIPKFQHPKVTNKLAANVKDELLQELKWISPKIRNCGYRFSTLQIYVEIENESEMKELEAAVNSILEKYKITRFSLVPSKIDEFRTCSAGRKVEVKHGDNHKISGTLGGFVQTSSEESEQRWALMSRHVAKFSTDGKSSIETGAEPVIAKIMKEIKEDKEDKSYLDIAVAKIEKEDENFTDTRYITEDLKLVPGKLCDYKMEKLQGLPVHIRGAATWLGLGTITVPERKAVQSNDLGENYIVVEKRDKEAQIPFCKNGDSGAIVCTDSPDNYGEEVHLISMVIGENLGQEGSYTTVRLDKGLEELNELTGKTFNPC